MCPVIRAAMSSNPHQAMQEAHDNRAPVPVAPTRACQEGLMGSAADKIQLFRL